MTTGFCQDAFKKTREETNAESIQVASFISRDQAMFFQEFLSREFEFVDIGNPSVITNPPSASSPLPLEKKGAIQFPPGTVSTQLEGRFDMPSVHQFTFTASQGQPSTIYIDSSSDQMPLSISTPGGRTLVDYQDGSTSWNGNLPESGTYTVLIVGFQAPSVYQLALTIEP
jgi:hypothetical protein